MRKTDIHISGAPGSGKSHLGDHLRQLGFFVVDMDEFFQPGDGRWEKLQTLKAEQDLDKIEEYRILWHEMKTERFAHYRKSSTSEIIVWVGLTDHNMPYSNEFYEMKTDHLFYIEISASDLCRQYYTRLCKETDTDWLNIPSSDIIITESAKMQEMHIKHGYEVLPVKEIEARIRAMNPACADPSNRKYILGKKMCSPPPCHAACGKIAKLFDTKTKLIYCSQQCWKNENK